MHKVIFIELLGKLYALTTKLQSFTYIFYIYLSGSISCCSNRTIKLNDKGKTVTKTHTLNDDKGK
nr:hypothetical protein BCU55_11615 [Shewanella sp. 10N.286.48.A6]